MTDMEELQNIIDELADMTHMLANYIKNPLNTAEKYESLAINAAQVSNALFKVSQIRRDIPQN